MTKDNLIYTHEMDCPICNKTHEIQERRRITQAIVKEEIVDYEEVYFLCPFTDEQENEFVPAAIMGENLMRARNAYRIQKGLLTSNEIACIRGFYGLSQSDFSSLLGWGNVTVTRYESKMIQDETYDEMMRLVYENPLFALECIEKHSNRFSTEKYNRIRNTITKKVEELSSLYLKKKAIKSSYVRFEDRSNLNGNKTLDIEKIANVIGYFAQYVENLYKVKLMKLLWYTDALSFRRHGYSMTGLVYKHMPLGALPLAYAEIISLPTVEAIEEFIDEDICYRIRPKGQISCSAFSHDELNILETVTAKFKDFKTKELIEYMHKEPAYTQTTPNQIIPFSLAKQLNELI